jgi:sugar fermentation stimulation protein A
MVKAVSVEWKRPYSRQQVRELAIPWNSIEREAHDSGCYIVIMRLTRTEAEDRKPRHGAVQKGEFYLYTGSAKNNLMQRMARHRSRRKTFLAYRSSAGTCGFRAALPVRRVWIRM